MKINVVVDEKVKEDEIIIKCKSLNNEIIRTSKLLNSLKSSDIRLIFYKDNLEYYFGLEEVIFFETTLNTVYAHTIKDVYEVKYRLYELEKLLPHNFLRISKSTIVNINSIFSLSKNITSSSLVEFYNTHKQIYVSRKYLKDLHNKIKEERYYEKME
jgi:DNA-binding LytR/AlgR family response regulator